MKSTQSYARDNDECAGFALVAVLLFLTLAASILMTFSLSARTHYKLAKNAVDYGLEHASLESMFRIGAAVQLAASSSRLAWSNGTVNCLVGSEDIQYSFEYINHAGLIDINAAGVPLLALGFESLGTSQAMSKELAQLVVRFRSPPISQNIDNAVATGAGVKGDLKFAWFEAVEELYDFVALSEIDELALKRVFTVHSRSGTLDILRSPPELAEFLAPRRQQVSKFLVESGRREPAFTLNVGKVHRAKGGFNLIGTFVVDVGGRSIRVLEPVAVHYGSFSWSRATVAQPECQQYFSPSTQDLVKEVDL